MPTIGLYFPSCMTNEDVNALRERLNETAAAFGYTASRGPTAGRGNLAEMLIAIDSGELALVLLPDEQIHNALQMLDRLYQEDEFYNAWARDITTALRDALQRGVEAERAEIEALD
jgi:hypothetical protein